MTVRDEFAWATSPTKEYVTATRMNKIGESFGSTRLVGMTTPGVDLTSLTTYIPLDFLQTPSLRVCFLAKATVTVRTPRVLFNVYTRASGGGASTDNSTFFAAGSSYGYPLMDFPLCDKFKDPWTWVESGRPADNKYDVNGFGRGVTSSTSEQLWWAQISLLTFPSAAEATGISGTRRFQASPLHQQLLLVVTVEEIEVNDMDYVKNLQVWEWPTHPESSRFFLDYWENEGGGRERAQLYQIANWVDKSGSSEGMGSKYDIFTGG